MVLQQLFVRFAAQAAQHLVVLFRGVAADVLVVHEVRGCHDVDGDIGGIGNRELLIVERHLTVGLHLHTALGSQSAFNAFLLHILHRGADLVQIGFLS